MIWLFPEREVPITASNILKSLRCSEKAAEMDQTPEVAYFSSVPFVLQMMAQNRDGLSYLKRMDLVGVGGASLPDAVGDDLVNQGINLVSRYGSTECGFLMSSHRDYASDKAWQYLRDSQLGTLRFEQQEDGLAELVVESCWPHMVKRNRKDGSYATADLFERHPSNANAWKYHSRADAQLTLISGKKFDPEPLEATIVTSSLVSEVLIFGNGQLHPGALVFRTDEAKTMSRDDIFDEVWPTVATINSKGQSHTRITSDMFIIMPSDASGLPKSSKGSVMRRLAETKYSKFIDNAYAEISNTTSDSPNTPTRPLPDHTIPEAVQGILRVVTGNQEPIDEDADLYSLGIDSLACMQIRASLRYILRMEDMPFNVVYDNGTIRNLVQFLINARSGKNTEKEDEIAQMQALAAQYSQFSGMLRPTRHSERFSDICVGKSGGEVVVLTGATGALGAHILDQLRSNLRISKIHCLVRAASLHAARERVSKSLVARRKAPLDTSEDIICCHPCKLSDRHLGLTSSTEYPDLYCDLADSTTVIIHAAWAVNFTMRLASFEKDHICGVQNLMNFALASRKAVPPQFVFCSSIASVLGRNDKSLICEKVSHDPQTASPMGYSRSKWVAELICEQAHFISRLHNHVSILRIGQLCGDTQHGVWNKTEAWPLMLSTGPIIGVLPDIKETLAWLPVDCAAVAVIEAAIKPVLSSSNEEYMRETPVYHIVNPHNQPDWATMLRWANQFPTFFSVVQPKAYLVKLDHELNINHPAHKLIGLWDKAYCGAETREVMAVEYQMDATRAAIPVMREVKSISKAFFIKIWNWITTEIVYK